MKDQRLRITKCISFEARTEKSRARSASASSRVAERAELLANFAMRVFERKELLEIIESAAWEPLRGLVQYLIAAQYSQDEREAEALAQLTDAVLAGPWATAGELTGGPAAIGGPSH
jgi:hypothetical protein